MASPDESMKQMFDVWQEGQNAFAAAQKTMAESMGKSFAQAMNGDQTEANATDFSAWQSFIKSWAPAWDPSANFGGTMDQTVDSSTAFFKLLDPGTWMAHAPEQLRSILESISKGPKFADLMTPQVDAAEVWRETLDFQQAAADFSKVLHDAWMRAYTIYSEKHSVDDLKSGKAEKALDNWLKIANAELLDTQRSEPFLDAQRRLLRAGIDVKRRQREQAETWCAEYQIPTRSEIDDLTHIVHELRAELRAVRRELDDIRRGSKK